MTPEPGVREFISGFVGEFAKSLPPMKMPRRTKKAFKATVAALRTKRAPTWRQLKRVREWRMR